MDDYLHIFQGVDIVHIHADVGVYISVCECPCMYTCVCVGQMLSADAPLDPSSPSFLSLPLNPEHISSLEELANELQARLPALGSQTHL